MTVGALAMRRWKDKICLVGATRGGGLGGRGLAIGGWVALLATFATACPRHAPTPVGPAPVAPVAVALAPEASAEPPASLAGGPSERPARRLAAAMARLLEGEGPPVRLRLFLPTPEAGGVPEFDARLRVAAEALRGATPRLLRVDITTAPFNEAAVMALRALAVLPPEGGVPEAVRCLVVAIGDELIPISSLDPVRGAPTRQLMLALHRAVRGPIAVGAVVPTSDLASLRALAAALPDFEVVPVDQASDPLGFAAIVVLSSAIGSLPRWAEAVTRRALDAGRGVVVLGGRHVTKDEQGARRVVVSPSDPTPLLAGTGLSFADGIVVDPACARVSVPSTVGRLFLSYPPLVRTTFRLPGGIGTAIAVLPFASPLVVPQMAGLEILARSSPASWVEPADADWNPSRTFRPGPQQGSQVLAVALDGSATMPGTYRGRLVVLSTPGAATADFLALEDNAIVIAAIVAWAAGIEDLFVLETEETEQ